MAQFRVIDSNLENTLFLLFILKLQYLLKAAKYEGI